MIMVNLMTADSLILNDYCEVGYLLLFGIENGTGFIFVCRYSAIRSVIRVNKHRFAGLLAVTRLRAGCCYTMPFKR